MLLIPKQAPKPKLNQLFTLTKKHLLTKPKHVSKRTFPSQKYKNFIKPIKKLEIPKFPKIFLPTTEQQKLKLSKWTPNSRRTGVIGVKMGMLGIWDKTGVHHACTIIKLDNLQVTEIKLNPDKKGLVALQLGIGHKNWNRLKHGQRIACERAGVPYKAKFCDFRVSPDALLPVGTPITVRHFVPGQLVDVQGKTIGKGFQGTIKRHGFKRQAKTHGVSKSHRKPGSQGMTGVGRVFPGKKGAGRMGGKNTTTFNLRVMKIDVRQNTIYLKGHIPGKPGTYIKIRDAYYKKHEKPPPYPTFFPDPYEKELPVLELEPKNKDPFIENRETNEIPS